MGLFLDADEWLTGELKDEIARVIASNPTENGFFLKWRLMWMGAKGLPVAVLEAWSYGFAVLMTRECNLPEGPDAGATLLAEANEDAIAEGLSRLFEMNDAELKHMGTCGRRLVETRFSWPHIAGEMLGAYEWVLGRAPKPHCVQFVNYAGALPRGTHQS